MKGNDTNGTEKGIKQTRVNKIDMKAFLRRNHYVWTYTV